MSARIHVHTLLTLTLGLAPIVGCDEFTADTDGLEETDTDIGKDTDTDTDTDTGAATETGAETETGIATDAEPAPSDPGQPPGAEGPLTVPSGGQLAAAGINLARGKPASQSSTYNVAWASLAVDGNRDGNYDHGSVTHTNNPGENWWQVDLEAVEPIGEVVISNRTDCCSERLRDFTVSVSSDLVQWQDFDHFGVAGEKTRVNIDRPARYVRIRNGENILSLAEVEVLRTRNLAYGKPTSQSSTAWGGESSRAVDGNADPNYDHGSMMHTDNPGENWWQVDLEAVQLVSMVAIVNRADCCSERLHDFTVSVSSDGSHWEDFFSAGVAGPITDVSIGRSARYVRIRNPGVLNLAEVKVLRNLVYFHHLGPWYAGFVYTVNGQPWGKGGIAAPYWDMIDIKGQKSVEVVVSSSFLWYNKTVFSGYLDEGHVLKTGGGLWTESAWIEEA